jgi:hypothetical protein
MYLYENEPLGDYPQTLGPGIDPIGSQRTMCPLLRQNGRDVEWLDYVRRRDSSKDPLSTYKKFLNEVAYRAYLESCKGDSIDVLKKQIRLFPWSKPPGPPLPPAQPDYLTCRSQCVREVERCPGGMKSAECRARGNECLKNCMGAEV